MAVHIGKIVHNLAKSRGIGAKEVGRNINMSESSVYKIYKRATIDIDKLIKLSQFFGVNLFEHYINEEPLKGIFEVEIQKLKKEIEELNKIIRKKDDHIENLEHMNATQKEVIATLKLKTK